MADIDHSRGGVGGGGGGVGGGGGWGGGCGVCGGWGGVGVWGCVCGGVCVCVGGGGGGWLGPKTDGGVPLAAENWTQKDRGKNEIWGLKDHWIL